jgi:hypothetical protein
MKISHRDTKNTERVHREIKLNEIYSVPSASPWQNNLEVK